jgi:hypothetical protein
LREICVGAITILAINISTILNGCPSPWALEVVAMTVFDAALRLILKSACGVGAQHILSIWSMGVVRRATSLVTISELTAAELFVSNSAFKPLATHIQISRLVNFSTWASVRTTLPFFNATMIWGSVVACCIRTKQFGSIVFLHPVRQTSEGCTTALVITTKFSIGFSVTTSACTE